MILDISALRFIYINARQFISPSGVEKGEPTLSILTKGFQVCLAFAPGSTWIKSSIKRT